MRWDKKGDNRMQKYHMDLIIKEVKHFDMLKERYDYADIDDLIAHYIEEEVITSEEELLEVIKYLNVKLGISIDPEIFKL
jgi:hypothetical protein